MRGERLGGGGGHHRAKTSRTPLCHRSRASRTGLSTVYRTLQALDHNGRLDTVRDSDGERLYRWRSSAGHQHYVICRGCGCSQVVDTEIVEGWAERIGESLQFTDVEHTLELSGVCLRCSTSQ
ncbi:transcriptional repressor [Streptomyces ficellus]|uniref:Transcriptional repressor n=1 Tax=Streptomyces ficellus TaxID=1977088 RepID=A0ABT7ZAK8_9ACTN|nr:transcriptional repressor [Streptomyces ficellus]MDN3296512.1 transcriptional repressor [Streptomyces ficellus]